MSIFSEDAMRAQLRAQMVPDRLIDRAIADHFAADRGPALVVQQGPRPPRNLPKPVMAPRLHRGQPEHDEQVVLFQWAALHEAEHPELRWLFAVPNWIGTRTRHHGAYLKAEGRKPGVPDIWLPCSRRHYHGLVIELKILPNRPSDEQRAWLAALEAADYAVHVCYSAPEAQAVILSYLEAA